MASEDFVPVTADDWYQRRRKDAEGEFFRKVASQGPRKGENDGTRQGIYVMTADGELLSFKNAGQNAEVTRDEIKRALAKFKNLPASRKNPGAVTVEPAGRLDPNYSRTPPPGGAILRTFTRILEKSGAAYSKGSCKTKGGDMAARDFAWFTAEEVRALVPAKAEVGFEYPLPKPIAERLTQFHLIDNTRGEPSFWTREQVRTSNFTLTVSAATAESIDLRLDGQATMATDADIAKADRGYEVRVLGTLRYKPATGTLDRFELTAIGEHWGDTDLTRGARTGRTPLGVVFSLVVGEKPSDRVPPQGARESGRYFGK